jgi:ferredoxin
MAGGELPETAGIRRSEGARGDDFRKRICLAPKYQYFLSRTASEDFMADLENKYEDNVKGAYFVDDQCIDCDLCRETAPENFTREEDGGFSFVFKQPENDEQIALCEEAMEGCPVEAIGEDGEEQG